MRHQAANLLFGRLCFTLLETHLHRSLFRKATPIFREAYLRRGVYFTVIVGHSSLIPVEMLSFLLVSMAISPHLQHFDAACLLWGHSLDFVLHSKSSPLRPGGRQPYNGAFGVGAAGPLVHPLLRRSYYYTVSN